MTILDQFVRDGDRLFRWRSYVPLVLLPVLVGGVLTGEAPFPSRAAERAWEILAVCVALCGLALRAWAVGTAPAGTSERSTVNPRASRLRTTGLYSMLRHPLYLANGLMAFGIALFPGIWYLPLIVALATMLSYERIAAREEQFLEEEFGEVFRGWAGRVPAVVPKLGGYVPSRTPMSWMNVLRNEFYGLMVVAASVFVLDAAEERARTGAWSVDAPWVWALFVTAVLFATTRVLKKTGLLQPRA